MHCSIFCWNDLVRSTAFLGKHKTKRCLAFDHHISCLKVQSVKNAKGGTYGIAQVVCLCVCVSFLWRLDVRIAVGQDQDHTLCWSKA